MWNLRDPSLTAPCSFKKAALRARGPRTASSNNFTGTKSNSTGVNFFLLRGLTERLAMLGPSLSLRCSDSLSRRGAQLASLGRLVVCLGGRFRRHPATAKAGADLTDSILYSLLLHLIADQRHF